MTASHDVIVVGAGTAGSVLAEGLTRSGRLRVLLIEAGGAPASRFVSIPAGFPRLFKGALDWAFESEPQAAVGGRRVFTPRGKMLGGSSNMNAQVHQWCHPADFDGWVEAGAADWGWASVAPIFRSQETWQGGDDQPGRGRSGPMLVAPNAHALPLSRAFVAAAREAGLGGQPHHNGGAYRGAWLCELAHRGGRRFSAYDAYLVPAMRRSNLEVMEHAHAVQVDLAGGRAEGVTVRAGMDRRSLAARAVVLAAGAIGSPQLLMLSGIGPGSKLSGLGVPVRVEAPEVGENLQDHPVLPLVFGARGAATFRSAESLPSLLRYLLFRRGMLASNAVEAFAFEKLGPGASPAVDLELIFLPLEFRKEFLEPPRSDAFSIGVAVVAPRSRGRLTLCSPDPLAAPAIDFGLLSDREGVDAAVLWAGVGLARKVAATAPLAGLSSGELRPGAATASESDLLGYAGQVLQTVYHPTSTCRMGSDARAVVDPRLRLKGLDGLWVADASVMPSVPRGHPNAVVAMIAQRAAGWVEAALTS